MAGANQTGKYAAAADTDYFSEAFDFDNQNYG
jgi:hypothetical protein